MQQGKRHAGKPMQVKCSNPSAAMRTVTSHQSPPFLSHPDAGTWDDRQCIMRLLQSTCGATLGGVSDITASPLSLSNQADSPASHFQYQGHTAVISGPHSWKPPMQLSCHAGKHKHSTARPVAWGSQSPNQQICTQSCIIVASVVYAHSTERPRSKLLCTVTKHTSCMPPKVHDQRQTIHHDSCSKADSITVATAGCAAAAPQCLMLQGYLPGQNHTLLAGMSMPSNSFMTEPYTATHAATTSSARGKADSSVSPVGPGKRQHTALQSAHGRQHTGRSASRQILYGLRAAARTS
jgi:hypothetical protein